ncbi:MAG: hypothetical protein GWP19_16340 [Planctomycetia bacterium]|nr:hypothetical protein [Planctomycetia bacterium]
MVLALFLNTSYIKMSGGFTQNSLSNNEIKASAVLQGVEAKIISISIVDTQIKSSMDNISTPLFEVFVNEITAPIHDHAIIKLSENRTVRIRVQNVGQFATDNLNVSVYIPLESSNLIFAGWTRQAPPINPKTKQEIPDLLHLWSVAAGVVPENGWFRTPLLSISKELPSPKLTRRALEELGFEFSGSAMKCPEDFIFHVLPVIVSVNSSQSTDHRFNLFLLY